MSVQGADSQLALPIGLGIQSLKDVPPSTLLQQLFSRHREEAEVLAFVIEQLRETLLLCARQDWSWPVGPLSAMAAVSDAFAQLVQLWGVASTDSTSSELMLSTEILRDRALRKAQRARQREARAVLNRQLAKPAS